MEKKTDLAGHGAWLDRPREDACFLRVRGPRGPVTLCQFQRGPFRWGRPGEGLSAGLGEPFETAWQFVADGKGYLPAWVGADIGALCNQAPVEKPAYA